MAEGSNTLLLGHKIITPNGSDLYFIAEIGQNHQGEIEIAQDLIREAQIAESDCVKFQKSHLQSKFTKNALSRPYTTTNSFGSTYGEHKEFLEFSDEQYKVLQTFCRKFPIDFTASAMDSISLRFLDDLNVPFIKIGSGDANNFPLLEQAARLDRPLIISTGMQTMETIKKIVEIMQLSGKSNYALMHCVSSYPTDPENCNLFMIRKLKESFPNIVIGYSGHELGIEITKAAVLLGARIIERHVTLNKFMKGSDQKCSLESRELHELIKDLKELKSSGALDQIYETREDVFKVIAFTNELNVAMHDVKERTVLECEWACKHKLGKSIVARLNLRQSHRISKNDICIKVSDPQGIYAEHYDQVIGKTINCDVAADEPILFEYIQ